MYLLWNKLANGYYGKHGDWILSEQANGKLSDLCLFEDTSDAIECQKRLGHCSGIIVFSEKTFRQKQRLRTYQFPGSLKPNYARWMAFGCSSASKPEVIQALEGDREAEAIGLSKEKVGFDSTEVKGSGEASANGDSFFVHGLRPVNPTGERLTYPTYLDKAVATVIADEKAVVYSAANIEETCESDYIKNAVKAMTDCKGLLETLNKKKKTLEDEIFTLDLMTSDELHRIEFNGLDAYQGYLAYKKLHNLRIQRRRAKNELFAVGAVGLAFGAPAMTAQKMSESLESINGLKQRSYRVRAPEMREE